MAERILSLDKRMLGVVISDRLGKPLCYRYRRYPGAKAIPGPHELDRIGAVEVLALAVARRPGQNAGRVEYVTNVYENFKLMIVELQTPKCVATLKVQRDANTDEILKLLRIWLE